MSTQLHDVDPIETQEWLDALKDRYYVHPITRC